ncbi:SDR family NAD(P)-dependent oxidoreductase [Nocardia puris]|uniref:Short-subunit dehydrogenase n=1 Tax=Nocardia puris TaxID=208602 RepID=A0A366E6L7_9NOCA|nr:SDR family NAD(P)-dependent oxidoreductase [Nocardia puris]MBF6216093.1 SDR family NAD(P)-dependent oxidoreductase [Nocardia puris]MBF6368896.1 SDR family NAD(P)-dependent oxidoreductase [Nocardia puris]MBF6462477.1 SDR family NAD(P)-dependent oxidoreductase [Nocardia puris]RBO97058.1 short-subunit dehydrogenase [Nocardia puris]
MNRKVVMITGAASGMGAATARYLAEQGAIVEGSDLGPGTDTAIETVDVRDTDAVTRWVEQVYQRHGRIDAVVTFAGYGLHGGVEETTADEAADLLDVNVVGSARVIRAALPYLRRQRSGHVVLVGSGSGIVAQPFGGWYSATKAAIEKLGDALRMEVRPFGIQVSVLNPGWTRTSILDASRQIAQPIPAYADARRAVADRLAGYLSQGQPAEAVARTVHEVLETPRTKQSYRVGRDVRVSYWLRKAVPPAVHERLVRGYYGIGRTTESGWSLTEVADLVDPATGRALTEISDGSLVDPAGEVAISVLDRERRLYRDESSDPLYERVVDNDRLRFAYRIYSKAYPLVATLVFWFVWNGKLRELGKFYAARLAAAAAGGHTFVEVGVGDGSLTAFATRGTRPRDLPRMLFIDLSPDMLVKAAKRLRGTPQSAFLVQDVAKLSLRPGSVHHLACFGALHVFPDPKAALTELTRALAPGGELSLSILTSPGVRWKDRLIDRFVATNTITSNFTSEQVTELISAAGLEITELRHNGHQLLVRATPREDA